jgi:nitrite reductase/ring-hydroxylating ferredoxin subunit
VRWCQDGFDMLARAKDGEPNAVKDICDHETALSVSTIIRNHFHLLRM